MSAIVSNLEGHARRWTVVTASSVFNFLAFHPHLLIVRTSGGVALALTWKAKSSAECVAT